MKYLVILVLFGVLYASNAFTPVFPIKLSDLYTMQVGMGWPHTLQVVEGHEALIKLTDTVDNQEQCKVKTPHGDTFEVGNPPSTRYESWTTCGLRVKNVTKSDYGRWRLTSIAGVKNLTGWSEMHVEDVIEDLEAPVIKLKDGKTQMDLELSSLPNEYCLVSQPFSDSSLISGQCHTTLSRITRALQGNWKVLLGIPGRVTELEVNRHVVVESESLDVGFIETGSNKLHLYCNLLNTDKNITFCRFQKTDAAFGFNVVDGLSNGEYSYYGEGFAKRQCGITIEKPTFEHYGMWKCTVGVQVWQDSQIVQKTPLQALLRVTEPHGKSYQRTKRSSVSSEESLIFAQIGHSATVQCTADASLTYCWFQHPNGSQFTPVSKSTEEQLFWYTGDGLEIGSCGITFAHVTESDAGSWTCHMGPRGEVGLEITDSVTLRVTGALAARHTQVTGETGSEVTLYCHSANGNRPLSYCRFLAPNYVGIHIDSTVTQQNAILDRFYFTSGRDLDHGDCSLTINPVQDDDFGSWTCAALVDDEVLESRDTILLNRGTVTARAGVIGMSVSASVLFVLFCALVVYRYRTKIFNRGSRRSNTTELIDMTSARASVTTQNSDTSFESQSSSSNVSA